MDPVPLQLDGEVAVYRERARGQCLQCKGANVRIWSYRDAKTVRFQNDLGFAADQAMKGEPPIEEPVALIIKLWLPIPSSFPKWKKEAAKRGEVRPGTRPDATNLLKATEDALRQRIIRDDSKVVDLIVRKFYSDVPGVEIVVCEPFPVDEDVIPPQHSDASSAGDRIERAAQGALL